MTTQEPSSVPDPTSLYRQLDAYPWSRDNDFQGGLQAILGSVQDPQQIEHLTLRAKCYYYARKAGTAVNFEGYKHWVQARSNTSGRTGVNGNLAGTSPATIVPAESDTGAGGMASAPKPASFAEICDLIAEGKPIPGIKDIPDTILEGQASESQAEKRRKPWERSAAANASPSWLSS